MKTNYPERIITNVASFLSTTTGFLVTFVALLAGIGLGAVLQFNDAFMFGFNILLSVAAIVISGIILVSGARSEAALHVKLDYLIEFSKASNNTVGLEHKDVAQIEPIAGFECRANRTLDLTVVDRPDAKAQGGNVPAVIQENRWHWRNRDAVAGHRHETAEEAVGSHAGFFARSISL